MEITPNPNISLYSMQLRNAQKQTQSNAVSIEHKGRNALVETLKSNPAAIYHKTEEQIPDTYDSLTGQLWSSQETGKERNKRKDAALTILNADLNKSYEGIEPVFGDFMKELAKISPELADKDWGFTVDEKGALVVFDLDKLLTKDETDRLTRLLNNNESLVSAAGEVPELLLKGFELERGPGTHSFGWARYDVTEENFKDIIDIRKFVDIAQDIAQYRDSGKDPRRRWKSTPIYAFRNEMESQLSARAENRYQAIRWRQGMTPEEEAEMYKGAGWKQLIKDGRFLQDQK